MEEKEFEKNKKNKKGLGVITILLVFIIIGMTGYIIYDKTSNNKCLEKKVIEEDETEEKIEYLDISSSQVQNLYNNIHMTNCSGSTTTLYRDGTVSIDKFKSLAFYLAYQLLEEEKGVVQDGGWKKLDSFTYNDLNQKAKLIFGKEFNMEDKKYDLCPYKYDSSTKKYTFSEEGGCGCTTGPDGPHMTLYQATKTDDEINLYESVVYQKYNEGSIYYTYYKDPLYDQKINDNSCLDGYSTKECIDDSTKYKFTFTKEDNNYILTNITKAN